VIWLRSSEERAEINLHIEQLLTGQGCVVAESLLAVLDTAGRAAGDDTAGTGGCEQTTSNNSSSSSSSENVTSSTTSTNSSSSRSNNVSSSTNGTNSSSSSSSKLATLNAPLAAAAATTVAATAAATAAAATATSAAAAAAGVQLDTTTGRCDSSDDATTVVVYMELASTTKHPLRDREVPKRVLRRAAADNAAIAAPNMCRAVRVVDEWQPLLHSIEQQCIPGLFAAVPADGPAARGELGAQLQAYSHEATAVQQGRYTSLHIMLLLAWAHAVSSSGRQCQALKVKPWSLPV
jgi:hypothetical protein